MANPKEDPVWAALDQGTFVAPKGPGQDQYGVVWTEQVPGENGYLGWTGFGTFYAVAKVELDHARPILVRADQVYRVYLDGRQYLAHPYKSRKNLLPLAGKKGENVIVVQAFGGSAPEAEVFLAEGIVYLNTRDIRAPDFMAGMAYEQYLGVAVANFGTQAIGPVEARVEETDSFEDTTISLPSLPALSVTKVPFRLVPKSAFEQGSIQVSLALTGKGLFVEHYCDAEVQVVDAGSPFRYTRRSKVDGSVQYFAVRPPEPFDPHKKYGLVLSLHSAGVEAIGQAKAYSPKDFVYIVAPTNRRPFGFDWEEWGRLDGIEALDSAMEAFDIDPTMVYVTGHSMGGHGTWQFGVLFPGRFAVVGPSAGWISFYTYTGAEKPTGPYGRARASSDTLQFVTNLARRAVYIIHGEDDDNVPIKEAKTMLRC